MYEKFASHLTNIIKALSNLLQKERFWTWDAPQERAFQSLKMQLSSAPVFIHHSRERPSKVLADSSSYGMGRVFLQMEGDDWKPSSTLHVTNSNWDGAMIYSGREGSVSSEVVLLEVHGFPNSMLRFTIETDHKPLLALLKSQQLDELTPKIQRFRMRPTHFL